MASSWHVAPSLNALLAEINARWPDRDKTSDGGVGDTSHQARISDHNPAWNSGGVVRARDFDKDGIDPDWLVTLLCRDYRVNYVIFNYYIYTRASGFRKARYYGINPHDHHVHVSIRWGAEYETDIRSWFAQAVSNLVSGTGGYVSIPTLGGGSLTQLTKEDFLGMDADQAADAVNKINETHAAVARMESYFGPIGELRGALHSINVKTDFLVAHDDEVDEEKIVALLAPQIASILPQVMQHMATDDLALALRTAADELDKRDISATTPA